jgi:hypothetical protein
MTRPLGKVLQMRGQRGPGTLRFRHGSCAGLCLTALIGIIVIQIGMTRTGLTQSGPTQTGAPRTRSTNTVPTRAVPTQTGPILP